MIKTGSFLFEAPRDVAAGLFGELGGGEVFVVFVLDDGDAVKIDVGRGEGETAEDAVGVLDGKDHDGAFGVIGHLERTGVEGEDLRLGEVFVAGALGGDADGADSLGDIFAGLLDDLRAGKDVALLDGKIARAADQTTGEDHFGDAFLMDEDDAAVREDGDEADVIEAREVV